MFSNLILYLFYFGSLTVFTLDVWLFMKKRFEQSYSMFNSSVEYVEWIKWKQGYVYQL